MSTKIPTHDELVTLAQEDPEQLEELREKWINDVIDGAPEELQRRLRGLQFQIDCKRRLHNNPMGACVEISKMMYESLSELNRTMNGLSSSEQKNIETATVLAFPTAG